MTTKADRFNQGKPQLSYVTSAKYAMEGLAQVMEFGAKKYARDNWKKGLDAESTIDSLLRHLAAYQEGETHDPESGCNHLDHVLANAVFLAYHHNGRKKAAQGTPAEWAIPMEDMYPRGGVDISPVNFNQLPEHMITVATLGDSE